MSMCKFRFKYSKSFLFCTNSQKYWQGVESKFYVTSMPYSAVDISLRN